MKISTNGVYDIPIESYHHDPNLCDGPSISASGLKAVADCPAKYWAFSPYNPNRFTHESTKALDLGKAAHALVLGEPEFAKHFFISPHQAFNSNPGKRWYNEEWDPAVASGRETRTLLRPDGFETVKAMAAAQRATPVVMQAFTNGAPEKSLIWRDEEAGIWLKARPDWLPNNPRLEFVVDYKTAVSIEPRKLSADSFKYGYHVQAAMQKDAVAALFKTGLGVAHVVQEKDPPYLCDLRMFAPEHIELGRRIYRKALKTFAACLKSGEWPAYTNTPQFFETPSWITRQIEGFDDGNDSYSRAPAYTASDYYANG